MAEGRTERGSRRRARAGSVVVPFPRSEAGDRLDLARFLPSGRSLLIGFAIVVGVLGAYWGARTSPLFDVRNFEVRGAPPDVARQVEAATTGVVGSSLLALDAKEIEATVHALPSIAGVTVDRAFPNTLVVRVAAKQPVWAPAYGPYSPLMDGSRVSR